MLTLSHWCLLLGAWLALFGALLVGAAPAQAAGLRRFARHVWAGRILATLAWVWGAYALYVMPLDFILPYRHYIPFVTLAAIPLSWFWMDDLLGCRAIGGLLVLFPAPLLKVTDLHPSAWRIVVVTTAYLALTAGMILILYPYHLRRLLDWLATHSLGRRACGAVTLAFGLLLLAMGLTVLR